MYLDETAWVAVAFIIFILLVWKKASSAITSILDNRSILIENELREAKSLKEEALEELRKILQEQKNVSKEAENIIREAKETARQIQIDAKIKSSNLVKLREEQAKQKILALEVEAINNIKRVASKIVVESSKNFLKLKIDKKENIELISKASDEIKTSLLN